MRPAATPLATRVGLLPARKRPRNWISYRASSDSVLPPAPLLGDLLRSALSTSLLHSYPRGSCIPFAAPYDLSSWL